MKLILILIAVILFAGSLQAETLTGKAVAVDGNHIEVKGETVKLRGMDAPDLAQNCQTRKGKAQLCGRLAKQYLARMLENRELECSGERRNAKGHLLVICKIGPFLVNEQMVLNGWALADPMDGEIYKRAELFAKIRKEGMWRGKFLPPWQWRKGNAPR